MAIFRSSLVTMGELAQSCEIMRRCSDASFGRAHGRGSCAWRRRTSRKGLVGRFGVVSDTKNGRMK